MGRGLENTERRASLSVETMTAFILQENVLKKNKQKAAASANAAAGTKTELSFFEQIQSEIMAIFNEVVR
ncbi:TPA: hypothetical protein LAN07_004438 [Escherichia coli]|uniref:Uncharacterized protein n=3 Tax=Escherichia coli TaxID=562 RepID=A0A2S8JK81_ECOLX|nr:hypothetical protein [Escherichia coli]ELW2702612.1 hypothetical protein [Escherichia coli O26]QYE41314.1 hypothetical protein KZW89_10135 [Escherichia coli O141:H4]EEQ1636605.1 hypothetical protein [Escherichia coli]EEQ2015496.1 hypothetical protein [Escherichia coli]